MANITGGGLEGNLNRSLPPNCDARIDVDTWPRPAVFTFMQERGPVEEDEMFRTFNMGVGYTMVVGRKDASKITARATKIGFPAHVIGEIVPGKGKVVLL
jgi:phosphoribosylformylglycinamidine cyclo-ligase